MNYIDIGANIQVLGNLMLDPSLFDRDDKFIFNTEDFVNDLQKILYKTFYNLHLLKVQEIRVDTVEDYLSQYPKKMAIYKANKGAEYLQNICAIAQPSNFQFNYDRMKKMTLLREYYKIGMDVSDLYDPDNILDIKKKQQQEDWLNNSSLDDIADEIDKKITLIRMKYADNLSDNGVQLVGSDVYNFLDELKENPDYGYPLYGDIFNTIFRGARLKQVYLRSAATNVGKSRSMIADACNFSCNEIYDLNKKEWIKNGSKEPTMYITTEQEKREIISMCLAFLSAVNEEHILISQYQDDEEDRVLHAAEILKTSPLYIQELSDFSLQDVENAIKIGIRDYNIKYICFDYIHSSTKILSEISSKSKVSGLREDNILYLMGVKIKDIANKYGVFILTSTQLNASYQDAKEFDQNLLRGAKSLGDKITMGAIMLRITPDDKEALKSIISQGYAIPDLKISIYKNRSGRINHVLVWCKADLGICRITPLFVTDYNYEWQNIDGTKINIKEEMVDFGV